MSPMSLSPMIMHGAAVPTTSDNMLNHLKRKLELRQAVYQAEMALSAAQFDVDYHELQADISAFEAMPKPQNPIAIPGRAYDPTEDLIRAQAQVEQLETQLDQLANMPPGSPAAEMMGPLINCVLRPQLEKELANARSMRDGIQKYMEERA